jgi:tRNA-dihydrouridine synthase 1
MLCRKYGVDLAYTPMMSSERFAIDPAYREIEFQTHERDRPLVAHFSANNPDHLLAAARHIETQCDAIDLNLGCPQRIAHSGHFGSYLLGEEDRELVLRIVETLASQISIPVFVKIRLLDTPEDTLTLCTQLRDAGASLIAIHARYRVNLVGRTGPGARDGPAHLDQV